MGMFRTNKFSGGKATRKPRLGKRSAKLRTLEPLESREMLTELLLTIENLSPDAGLFQTPFWVGFHDGRFDLGTLRRSADRFSGLEELAEEGDTSGVSARFAQESDGLDATIVSPGGFGGAPVFDPGEVVTHTIDVPDPGENRYFSFASMVIPSNDAFLANLGKRAHRLFNGNGRFRGPITIDLAGRDVYDAGTEVNDPQGGAAFSTEGGISADESGVIHRHTGLGDFIGTGLPTGDDLGSSFIDQTPLARITISLASDPSDPIDHQGPDSTLGVSPVAVPGSSSHEFEVIYSDPSGVDVSSIDTSDVRILPRIPGGHWLRPTSVTTDAAPGTNPRTVVATYTIDAPGGDLGPEDSGEYRVYLRRGQVNDSVGNDNRGQRVGSFEIDVAAQLEITIENLSIDGGLYLTPFWVGFHNGRFDLGGRGRSADQFPGLEELAEEGDTSVLSDYFNQTTDGVDTTILAPGGFPGAPVLDPGETVTEAIDVAFAGENRFFSFASMVIPSNDAFLANLSSRAHRVFDHHGRFRGPIIIELVGRDVLDAGTEVNNPQGGAAFSTEGGVSENEGGRIRRHRGLDEFIGTGIATGESLESTFKNRTPLARITIQQA